MVFSMNYKLEKFWNLAYGFDYKVKDKMNYKLEKFWNRVSRVIPTLFFVWTINLKSFEMAV